MWYSKGFKFYIGFSKVGAKAYDLSKVWRLGPHLFKNGGDLIFRICYLRTKKRTYYWQVGFNYKSMGDTQG